MIKGITITLFEKKKIGYDPFKHPVYEEIPCTVDNVLVSPATVAEATDLQNLIGKKAVYNIAIPKGDAHKWEDNRVEFFGESWQVVGPVMRGIEANIPGTWHEIWKVVRYE